TVTAADDEGDAATASASATVSFTDVRPEERRARTDSVASVREGGARNQSVTYTYVVTNDSKASTDPLTVSSVLDSKLGELLTAPLTLAPGASATLTKTVTLAAQDANTDLTNTVTVTAADDEGDAATASASATVSFTDV